MISTKLINLTLDAVMKSNPVAEFAENLANSGVTEEQLHKGLAGRNDPIAVELQTAHSNVLHGRPNVNKYGVAVKTNSTRPQKRRQA
jgi:hypothetical protein